MRPLVAAVVVALALGACSGSDDTSDPVDPTTTTARPTTTTATPQASIEVRPVVAAGLPCDGLPPEYDPAEVYPSLDDEQICSQLGPGATLDLARAEATEGGARDEEWVIEVEVVEADRAAANEQFDACATGASTCVTRQLAIVVDDAIVSAPTVNEQDLADQPFVISGGGLTGFTQAEAQDLVDRLRDG